MENEPYFTRKEQEAAVLRRLPYVVDFFSVSDFLFTGGTFKVLWEKGQKRPTVVFGKRVEKKKT